MRRAGGLAGAVGAQKTGDLAVARHERDVPRPPRWRRSACSSATASIMAPVPSCSRRKAPGDAAPGRPHRDGRGAALSRKSAINLGTQPVASWPWPSPRKIRCRWRVSPLASTLGIGGRGHRDRLRRTAASVGTSLVKGACRSASTGPLRPELADLRERIQLIRALVGLRHGRRRSTPAAKKGTSSLQITLFCMPLAS